VNAAFVDMSGGSSDDAVLAIAHKVEKRIVVDLVEKQAGRCPFDPRAAVAKFTEILRRYRLTHVIGDRYAGETFRLDFQGRGVVYQCSELTTSELYEQMEPRVNAGEVELPDLPVLTEQLLTLVQKGARVTHESGAHDDWANACAGAVQAAAGSSKYRYDCTLNWVSGPDDADAAARAFQQARLNHHLLYHSGYYSRRFF
jgi:hypothetical protein